MAEGTSSQFADDLQVEILNVFGLQDSVISTIGQRIGEFVFKDNDVLFNVNDIRVPEGEVQKQQGHA